MTKLRLKLNKASGKLHTEKPPTGREYPSNRATNTIKDSEGTNDDLKCFFYEINSLNKVCDIKALISQVHQIKAKLKSANSQYKELRVCFENANATNDLH